MSYKKVLKKYTKLHYKPFIDDYKLSRDKEYFRHAGVHIYFGKQGSGKTISAIKHLHDIKKHYPKCIVVSNVKLEYFKPIMFQDEQQLHRQIYNLNPKTEYILFTDREQLAIAMVLVQNGKFGVIYFIDEIHLYHNALESASIPMYVFTEISQHRKQRKLTIATSQRFTRIAKPFREQASSAIKCSTLFGKFTFQKLYDPEELEVKADGTMIGTIKKRGFFMHDRKTRNSFDTYQKVVTAAEQYEQLNSPTVSITQTKKGKSIKVS